MDTYVRIDIGFLLYSQMLSIKQDKGKSEQDDMPAEVEMSKSPLDQVSQGEADMEIVIRVSRSQKIEEYLQNHL